MKFPSRLWPIMALIVAGECAISPIPQCAEAAAVNITEAAIAEHLGQLAKQVPEGFTVISQSPFVVLGDEPPDVVRRRATHTVKWAVAKLKQDYFKLDPLEIIDIWLFQDDTSYTN